MSPSPKKIFPFTGQIQNLGWAWRLYPGFSVFILNSSYRRSYVHAIVSIPPRRLSKDGVERRAHDKEEAHESWMLVQ